MDNKELLKTCQTVRVDIVNMVGHAGSGHCGGSLSAVEIVVGLYFGGIFRHDAKNAQWQGRDRFILSKGHAAPVIYSVLARKGFYGVARLDTLRKLGSILQGHPNAEKTPGIDCSSGSLGQGLSISNGLGIAFKKLNMDNRVYCLMGDGELQEGQIWEAAMTAKQHKLDNICAIVDCNNVQLDGTVSEIKDLHPLREKWLAFGWHVIELDGHNIEQVIESFRKAADIKGLPTVLLCHTIKGKGISYMENRCEWHGTAPNAQQLEKALKEIHKELRGMG